MRNIATYLTVLYISASVEARGNLRRTSEVECPCVNFHHDSILVETETVKFDLHRTKSCTKKAETLERIYWTPINIDERPDSDIVQEIDGIKWNHLSAINDKDQGYYSCTRNDYRLDNIKPEEAEACMTLLYKTCDKVMPKLCDFGITDLEKVKDRAKNGDFMIDQEKSCNNHDFDFGIFEKPTDPQVGINWKTNQSFIVASNPSKIDHCANLVEDTCSAWNMSSSSEAIQCQDDANFEVHSNIVAEDFENVLDVLTHSTRTKNCAWVAQDLSRCRRIDKSTEKRVFESCRQTCGYCTCSNNDNYTFNGQPDKKCDWIAEDNTNRCELQGAKENCKSACNTDCCKDNSNFTFEENHQTCKWVANNKKRLAFRCSKRVIAANCPETCGLCPA